MDFQDFKESYQQIPIKHYSTNVPSKPMVSVCVQTYQHADYIKDCLDGILMQETDFSFEILLGEDASSDSTREICIEYAEKYPHKIRLFLHRRENNIQVGGQPTGRFNFLYNLYMAKGKYIAFCEGDDFWTDSLKLQKQVAFMEAHTQLSGVYANFSRCNIDGEIIKKEVLKKDQPLYFNKLSVFGRYSSRTLTVFYKNIPEVVDGLLQFMDHVNIDRVLAVLMAQHGNIRYLNFVSGVYRSGSGYHSTMQAEKKRNNRLRLYKAFKQYFNRKDIVDIINKRLNELYTYEMSRALLRGKLNYVRNINKTRKKETGMDFRTGDFFKAFSRYIAKACQSRFEILFQKIL